MKNIILIFLIPIIIIACSDDPVYNDNDNSNNYSWLIPVDEVYDGGPGKDGIPALDSPELIDVDEVKYLENDDLVLGIVSQNDIIAYPHKILDWHEIINTSPGNIHVAITYCPLTGTGIGWNREINGSVTTFGVSGLLYNSNLIPYDRQTDSNWSQIGLDCVYGLRAGTNIEVINIIETNWETWKSMYPNSKVVSTNTGYTRNYDSYPYGTYKTNESLIFPVNPLDNRLHIKERVHGIIINDQAKTYRFSSFSNSRFSIIEDEFQNKDLLIIGSQNENLIVSFINETTLNFQIVQDQLPIILEDNEGNSWDIWGNAVSGPREGEELKSTISFMGFWFAWGAFYPDAEIYN